MTFNVPVLVGVVLKKELNCWLFFFNLRFKEICLVCVNLAAATDDLTTHKWCSFKITTSLTSGQGKLPFVSYHL